MPLSQWLKTYGLGHLERVLVQNDIAEDVLGLLTEHDLEKLGLSMGDRKRLMAAIAEFLAPESGNSGSSGSALASVGAGAQRSDEGELRQLTILFCDLVDSTALCERLAPEQWREVVLAYQQASCGIVERYGGSVAQYLGDGILVYFGHPQAYEDAPERAVRAAMAMVDAIRDLRLDALAALATQATRLSVRIGIHTGQVVIGHVGAGAHREHLALGDTPNIAARLQGLAAPGTVVLSDSTRRMAGGSFAYADLGKHRLKGVREPRHVFRVDAILSTASRFDAATGTGLSPLVGRGRELGLLIERWELARQGRGQTVFLGGEAGVGKSRILKELRARLGNAGLGVHLLQCSAHQVETSFHPSIDALTRTLELSRDQPAASKLDRLDALVVGQYGLSPHSAAVIAAMLSLPGQQRYPPLVSDAHVREQETIAALVAAARARAALAPALMIVEDAHWADSATMAMLAALIEGTADVPLLLIVTHRPEFRLGEHLASRPNVVSVRVAALEPNEVTELVARMAGDSPLADDLTRHILSKTDGVPLFVEELTRWILETSATSDGPRKEVPATLRDSLMARLDRDPRAKEVAQIGSIFGREFRRDMLVALADMPASVIAEGLGSLTR
ncbi:MAG TPA: adenylate/guanylate cyclase domain-containing protein, partial [Polyangiaceae bacterium]